MDRTKKWKVGDIVMLRKDAEAHGTPHVWRGRAVEIIHPLKEMEYGLAYRIKAVEHIPGDSLEGWAFPHTLVSIERATCPECEKQFAIEDEDDYLCSECRNDCAYSVSGNTSAFQAEVVGSSPSRRLSPRD